MTITALERGLEILRLLSQPDIRQVKQLHEASGLPKPTIVRMLETLMAAGYVLRDAEGGYRLTARVLGLAAGYRAAEHLVEVAQPILTRLREANGWPSDMGIFDRDAMVLVETARRPGVMTLNRPVGSRLPLLVSAMGRAYLAFCPPEERARTIEWLSHSGDPYDAAAREPERLEALFAKVRERGHAISDGELLKTTLGVGAPVLVHGRPVAAINLMVVSSAMSMKRAERIFAPRLKEAAREIGEALSHSDAGGGR